MMDLLTEIYVSMSRNKLRISLTGFSIAWGIFLLIVLLSAGDGLLNAMRQNFASDITNTINVSPGWTSEPFEGLPLNRRVKFDENIKNILSTELGDKVIEAIPVISQGATVSYGEFNISSSINGQRPGFLSKLDAKLTGGRSLNEVDIRECRKVLLIAEDTAKELFQKESPLGKWVNVGEIPFQIVGTIKNENQSVDYPLYAPISTVNILFNPENTYNQIQLITEKLETTKENEDFNDKIVAKIAEYRRFSPDDQGAVWVSNRYESYLQMVTVMAALDAFIWLIGIASLIAGIVGVSNIMLITVRERTREFGIRKAIGATPASVLKLVLLESIGITMLFGYVGMVLGFALVKGVTAIVYAIEPVAEQVFANPSVNVGLVLAANVTLIIAGLIAGYVPAKRAVSIKPVVALAAL